MPSPTPSAQARKRAGLTQAQVARRLGVSVRSVRRHESGRVPWPYHLAERLWGEAGIYHCSASDLMTPADLNRTVRRAAARSQEGRRPGAGAGGPARAVEGGSGLIYVEDAD